MEKMERYKAKIRPNYKLSIGLKRNNLQCVFDNDDILLFEKYELNKQSGINEFYFSIENELNFNDGKTFIYLRPGDFYWID